MLFVTNAPPNPYTRQAQHYQRQQIETASPEQILILLYEGAIKFLMLARQAYENPEKRNIQAYHNNLIRAQAIIMEFMNSLDMEIGGEVAKNLYALYEYLHYRLVQANIKKDVTMIDEVLNHLRQLKVTWEEAIRIAAREKSATGQRQGHQQDQFIDGDEVTSRQSRHA